MIKFFSKPNEKVFNLKDLDRETLIYRVLPHFLMEILRKYFRLEIEGLEHVPRKGRILIAPNHSGYSGFDAFVINHVITKDVGRRPKLLAHYFWFLSKTTGIPAKKLGFTEATYDNGLAALKKNYAVILFPEGEHGNFKPTSEMYQLQTWLCAHGT
jgi:1-acyl-sn-glycerol-3-phosphate acyltransferase